MIKKGKGKGKHRKRRDRAPWPGMMLHQDGCTHQWVPGVRWDLIVTMDDATNEHYSMFFVDEEGTASSFEGIREVIEAQGLFSCLYTDRGSHYWYTPEVGGKVDKNNLTQFGRAMRQLGVEMIPAYSPEARGRSERMFRTHQDRLPKELEAAGITDMVSANEYLKRIYMPAFNEEFMQPALEQGSAFVAYVGRDLADILCEQHDRVVGNDNCVSFEGVRLQIPKDCARLHCVKVRVRVHAGHFFGHGLVAIIACTDLECRKEPHHSHGVQHFMTFFERAEHFVPLALYIGAIGMQTKGETGFGQYPLAGRNIARQADTAPDRHHAKIYNHLHHALLSSGLRVVLYEFDKLVPNFQNSHC